MWVVYSNCWMCFGSHDYACLSDELAEFLKSTLAFFTNLLLRVDCDW